MAISKQAANKKYDELRAKLKSGEMTQKQFKIAADRIYKMYHSDKNKSSRTGPVKKPAAKPPVTAKTEPAKPPKTKAEPPKTKTKPPQTKPEEKKKPQRRGGSRSRRAGGGTRVNIREAVSNFASSIDKKLKLTHKKGDVKKIGNSTFMWNGRRWVKQNRPF